MLQMRYSFLLSWWFVLTFINANLPLPDSLFLSYPNRRAVSEETKTKRGNAEESRSRGTETEPGSTWSTSREGRTGAAAAARQSSGNCPHTCTLIMVTVAPPAMGLLLAPESTTPPWPWPCHSPMHKSQRKRMRMKRKMKRQLRAMESTWGPHTTLHLRTATSTSPPSLGRRQKWRTAVGR